LAVSKRDWRYYRERQRGRGRGRRQAEPKNAREALERLLAERLGRRGFPAALEVEAGRAADAAEASDRPRRDLTELPTFTIDPASARDFDDAISARREEDGVRLWVHIADVAAHVRPGSPLDLEARRRANSTYVPGAVEPMLPRALSEEACSLTPDVERLAVTAEIELDDGGRPRAASFYRSRIRSGARLDYDQLDLVFAGRGSAPENVAEPLAVAREAAAMLAEHRGTTSLEIESSEPEFRFDAAGNVVGAHSVAQTESHRLIERLMILANEQVAQLLERKRVPAVYRVHAQPDPLRIERLVEQLGALGVPTPPLRQGLAPGQAGEVAAEASRLVLEEAARRGHGREAYTSLVLRSLMQASYSDRNSGHAGLGSSAYCHFTSPIRRYPDLLVHRALRVGHGLAAPGSAPDAEALVGLGGELSRLEKRADEADRFVDTFLKCAWLRDRVGQVFEGLVTTVVEFGYFVQLLEPAVDGLLHLTALGDDIQMRRDGSAWQGKRSGRVIGPGQRLRVRVTAVNPVEGMIDLELAEPGT